MTHNTLHPATLRRVCGNVYTHVRDHWLGATRTAVFEVPCDKSFPVEPARPVAFRFGCRSDVEVFTRLVHEYGEAEKKFSRDRLERGDSVVVGESGGSVLFYAWLMYGQMDLDQGVCLSLSPDVAYSYKVFTVRSARGLSICPAYYHYIKKCLQVRGFNRLICRVNPANAASIRAHLRAGFVTRGMLWKIVTPLGVFYYADRPLRGWIQTASASDSLPPRGLLARGLS